MSIAALQQVPSIKRSFDAVFPLPLTTFESFMFADTRPEFPMMCDMEVRLSGRVDREAFERALAFAVARNPLMASLIARGPRGSLHWVASELQPPVIWTTLDAPLDDRYGAGVDLMREPGLLVWVRQGEDQAKVLLHFHHACSDGIGGFAFIEDLLAGYSAEVPGGEPVEARPLDPARLKVRGEVGITGRPLLRRIVDTVIGAREGARFFLQSPRPLATVSSSAAAGCEPPLRPGFVSLDCADHVADGLRRAASQAGSTLNDVLMRDLFMVLRDWNAEHESLSASQRLRILMPQSLRGPEEATMPAANVMGFAFVTRRADWCDRPAQLLESIREETEAVRRGKLSLYFVGGLEALQSSRLLSPVLGSKFCFATAVLTNLSDPTRRFVARFPRVTQGLAIGNLVLEGIAAVPPLRPRTRAVFAIVSNARALSICFKWDAHLYSSLDGQRLLSRYIAQLESTAAGATH